MKTIIDMYREYRFNEILNDSFINPLLKSEMLSKINHVYGLYIDGFISGRECMQLLSK